MRPVVMPPNRLAHFYLGGEAITRLRQVPAPADRSPEEWLASTTTRHGDASIGLSSLPDGRLLRDAVQAEPEVWTGRSAAPGGPGDVGVLVKLLDAGQRLPVHVHPSREFATDHLGSCYGKTEAWYVVETADPAAQVYLGFREDVPADDLLRAVEAQDSAWMLERMHAIPVQPGDVILVPAGTAHAIGAGIFLVEIQEPTDFSLLLEWTDFATVDDAFLGLDQGQWVSMVQHTATPADTVAALSRHVDTQRRAGELVPLLPAAADPFFRADLLAPASGSAVTVPAGFAVVVTLAGAGSLTCSDGDLTMSSGDVLAVPHATGDWQLQGDVTAVLCRPAVPGEAP